MHRRVAFIAVIASSACFATLAVLARLAYSEGGRPLPILAWRFAIAAALLGGYLLARRPSDLRAGLKDLPRYAALSLSGYGAASLCFFFALQHASASVVTVLLYAYPAIVTCAEAALKRERVGTLRWLAIALTFAGCALAAGLVGSAVRTSATGIALGLGAAGGYAVFTLLSARLAASRPRLVMMTYTFAFSAVAIAAVSLGAGESLAPIGWTTTLWVLLGLIVLLPTFAAVLLFLRGVRSLGPARAALASTTEPVFTILLAAAFLGERMALVQLVGAGLVVAGIALSEWPDRAIDAPAVV